MYNVLFYIFLSFLENESKQRNIQPHTTIRSPTEFHDVEQ